jgi:hypothetical protein
MRGRPVRLTVEVNARHDLDRNDRGGDPVDNEAERTPPSGVRNKLTSVLPEILEPVARETEDEQLRPIRRSFGLSHDPDPMDAVAGDVVPKPSRE